MLYKFTYFYSMKKHNQFQSLLILIAVAMFVSCGPSAEEIAAMEKQKSLDSLANIKLIVAEERAKVIELVTTTEEPVRPIKTWNGKDLGLPSGVITGGSWFDDSSSESYLEIKQPDGVYVVIKGVSLATYTAVEKNDIIK